MTPSSRSASARFSRRRERASWWSVVSEGKMPLSSLTTLLQPLLNLRARQRRIVLALLKPLEEVGLDRLCPARVDLARRVGALLQTHVAKFVLEMDHLRVDDHLLGQVGGDRDHAGPRRQDDV